MIGSTRESTNIALNDLKRRGLIEIRRRRIWITNSEKLREHANPVL